MGDFLNDLLGGPDVDKSALKDFKPIGIRAGGITAGLSRLPGETVTRQISGRRRVAGGQKPNFVNTPLTITETRPGPQVIDLTTSDERQGLVSDRQSLFQQQADEVADLRDQALSGLGLLGEVRQRRIEDARRRTVGNLRDSLARRRVLGSSFGQDAIARAEREFARESGEAEARTALEQLEIKRNLIDREFNLRQKAVQTRLNEMNFQSKIAASLATGATDALQASAEAQAAIASEQASGMGELIGTIGGAAIAAFSDIRLKKNIKRIGVSNSLPVYSFSYIWDSVIHIGHMAHEVVDVVPDAVMTSPSGYLMVDYGKLGY